MLFGSGVIIHVLWKKVWEFPTDPNQIGQCVPGIEKIETVEEIKKYRNSGRFGLTEKLVGEQCAASWLTQVAGKETAYP